MSKPSDRHVVPQRQLSYGEQVTLDAARRKNARQLKHIHDQAALPDRDIMTKHPRRNYQPITKHLDDMGTRDFPTVEFDDRIAGDQRNGPVKTITPAVNDV